MRRTIDLQTGKPFRWNDTVQVRAYGRYWVVPARHTQRVADYLHPDRVPATLLARLNHGATVAGQETSTP